MARQQLRANAVAGAVEDDPLAVGSDTLTSAGLEDLPAIDATQFARLALFEEDPTTGRVLHYEIVHVTAHTAAVGSATILRGQEGTSAREWPLGTLWRHVDTVETVFGVGIDVLPDDTNAPADLPTDYPLGISLLNITDGIAQGWPEDRVTVITFRATEDDNRALQWVSWHGEDGKLWFRVHHATTGWTPLQVAGEANPGPPAYAMGVIKHGSDPTVARPAGYGIVTWIGVDQPDNIQSDDVWIKT